MIQGMRYTDGWWVRCGRFSVAWLPLSDYVPLSVREGWTRRWRLGKLELSWDVGA